MTSLAAQTLAIDALPIVDIAGLSSPVADDRAAVGRALRAACLDKGFFYIAGHGVPEALVAEMFGRAAQFFALPERDKLALAKRNSNANRGYEPLEGQRLEENAPPDLKESFFMGPELAADHPDVLGGRYGAGPNQWPELAGFRDCVERYSAQMHALGRTLYRGLALSLDLDEDFFDGFYRDPLNIVRMIHYPKQPANPLPNQKGCGAHTDFGGVTILAQDDAGGLQVWDESSGWIHATPVAGTFVVNLGDFMQRWTNGLYRSTLHRVVNVSGRERYSIPTFVNGTVDYEVSCIPTCLAPGETPKYGPTSVAAHFRAMYAKTYLA